LVRKVGVRPRARGDDGIAGEISRAKPLVRGRGQIEVGQSIVNEINALWAEPQCTVVVGKLLGSGDMGGDAVALEQTLEQNEFGIEILADRVVIDDGDATEATGPALLLPFALEARDEHIEQLIEIRA